VKPTSAGTICKRCCLFGNRNFILHGFLAACDIQFRKRSSWNIWRTLSTYQINTFLFFIFLWRPFQIENSSVPQNISDDVLLVLGRSVVTIIILTIPLSIIAAEHRTLKVCNDFSMCCRPTHEDKTRTDESARVLTRKNWKQQQRFFSLSCPRVEPWLPDLQSSALVYQPRAPVLFQNTLCSFKK